MRVKVKGMISVKRTEPPPDEYVQFTSDAPHETLVALRDRVPILMRLPFSVYGHLVAWLSEYIATTFFLFLALSGEQVAWMAAKDGSRSAPDASQLLYASLSHGFAFAVSSWAFFRVTSGLFNPAITIGMCLLGSLSWVRGGSVIIGQFLGAMTAAGLVDALFPGPLMPRVELGGGTSVAHGFFIELLLTTAFVFMIFMLAADRPKGLLCGIMFTGCSLNPARAFAVSVAAHSFTGYHWIYWLGPILGSVLASGLHMAGKQLEVETADAKHRVQQTGKQTSNVQAEATPVEPQAPGHKLSAVLEHDVEKGETVDDHQAR